MPAPPLETVHPLRACRLEPPGKIPLQGLPPYFRELGRDRLLPGTPRAARRPESARSPERGHDDKRHGREGTYQQEHFPEIPAHAAPVNEKCQQKAGSFGESGDRRDLQGKERKDREGHEEEGNLAAEGRHGHRDRQQRQSRTLRLEGRPSHSEVAETGMEGPYKGGKHSRSRQPPRVQRPVLSFRRKDGSLSQVEGSGTGNDAFGPEQGVFGTQVVPEEAPWHQEKVSEVLSCLVRIRPELQSDEYGVRRTCLREIPSKTANNT